MEYRKLGRTGIKVSAICLGTMTWGEQNTEAEGHEQMDYALAQGVNFFDAAELYPIPPRAETQGRTEEIIGTWFAARKTREKIILATKISGRSPMDWFRKDKSPTRQTRAQINEAVDASLRRLKTDYIDLYQLHWPDRPVRLFGGSLVYKEMQGDSEPVADIIAALGDCVKAGKIRHIGLSNETPWGMMAFAQAADANGAPRILSIQNAYNLLNRTFEMGGAEIAQREAIGLLAYSPLAQGYLSGKYQKGALPKGSRKQLFQRLQRYETPKADATIDAYLALARKYGLDPAQMAQQFVTTRPFVAANIIGATTMAQLKIALASPEVAWSDEIEKDINAIHIAQPNPCP